jgi:hypothetical protein
MTSILFPSTLTKAHIYKLPPKLMAVSYLYTTDMIFIRAYLKDKSHEINNEFMVGPCIFEHAINHISSEKRFKSELNSKFWLKKSKLVEDQIYVSKLGFGISNVHSDNTICWGRSRSVNSVTHNSMASLVDDFFSTPFNNDLCDIKNSKLRISTIRKINLSNESEFTTDKSTFISKDADALYMVHRGDNPSTFLRLSFAGFNPLPHNVDIMFIPLKHTAISRNSTNYEGYVTPLDANRRKWFILPDGRLVGQMDTPKTVQQTQPTA